MKETGILSASAEREKNSFELIYDVVRLIPRGKVATYGQVASLAGNRRWSRVVGYALHVNPDPDGIPCYRVVDRNGHVSSAFAFGGGNRQIELLQADGIPCDENGCVDLRLFRWDGMDTEEDAALYQEDLLREKMNRETPARKRIPAEEENCPGMDSLREELRSRR